MGKSDKHNKSDKHDRHDKSHKLSKAEKQLAKLTETEEEKRARRLAKKAAKAAREKEESQVAGYSNDANPWNDPRLTEQFVWGKKVEKEGGGHEKTSKDAQKRRRDELAQELEKVKRAREQREREKEEFEEERRLLEREREQMAFADNAKREDEFQHQQSRQRAFIRHQEGRARPIDLVCASLTLFEDDVPRERALEVELQDPMDVFHRLSARELRELKTEISSYGELDEANRPFWGAMAHICDSKLQGAESANGGVHDEVRGDIVAMLAGKSVAQLDELRAQIVKRQQEEGEDMDMDYWDAVLLQMQLARARATVAATFGTLRRRRAELCGSGGGERVDVEAEEEESAVPVRGHSPELESDDDEEGEGGAKRKRGGASGRFSPELVQDEEVDYDGSDNEGELAGIDANADADGSGGGGGGGGGRFSPVLLTAQEIDRDEAVDETEDFRVLQALRSRVRAIAMDARAAGGADAVDTMVAAEANKGLGAGEAQFSFEVPLEKKVAWWHDKYKPRKPKYFNRVHTGYEWNKYNQTHYDHDNPPPKMVQGYKFNIFYPDLIDRSVTPTYQLLPDPSGAKDTCILRIHGGPPYEDLAFKIVNREWETSHKRGFRVRFERGILQLFFNFKRYRYRR